MKVSSLHGSVEHNKARCGPNVIGVNCIEVEKS